MADLSCIRSKCRLCDSDNISLVLALPSSIIADQYADQPFQKSVKHPLDLYQCSDCGHVQHINILPLEILFNSTYTYKPSANPSLIEHFSFYANRIQETLGHVPSKSLDIGSNDGLFLSLIKKQYSSFVLGVDPAQSAVTYAKDNYAIDTIMDFFTFDLANNIQSEYGKFDHISANNVFAHNDDLRGFVNGVSHLLSDGGVFTFEFSYLFDIINKSLIGTIFHEHLSHHSISSLIPFLKEFDLHLFDVDIIDTQGGALIGYASKSKSYPVSQILSACLKSESAISITSSSSVDLFAANLSTLRNSFQAILNDFISSGSRVIVFGAARSTNTLIEFFQIRENIDFILDDNPDKIGRYLHGTSVQIMPSRDFEFHSSDIIIPFAWIHSDRIFERISALGVKCSFLSFYPSLKLASL